MVVTAISHPSRNRTGFTLIELLLVIAIVSLLVAILLPGLAEARRTARQALNVSNLKQFGISTQSYSSDFKDSIWTFSWVPGGSYNWVDTSGNLVPTPAFGFDRTGAFVPAAHQATSIIRARAWTGFGNNADHFANWIPYPSFSHLVVLDYLATKLPAAFAIAPEDRYRQSLADDPQAWIENVWPNLDPQPPARFPYSSSYFVSMSAVMPDNEAPAIGGIRQGESQITYAPPNYTDEASTRRYPMGGRRLSEVGFPSQKVHMHEDVGRTNARTEYFFTHPFAKTTNIMYDASVRTEAAERMNLGGHAGPNRTSLVDAPIVYAASPNHGFGLWPDTSLPTRPGRQRWTAFGLKGIDVGGTDAFPPGFRANNDRRTLKQ